MSWFMQPSKNHGNLSAPITVLADGDVEELRILLSKRLKRLAQNGERDVWRLANGAIGELRRELTVA
jgi:hypothetical protein